MKYKKKEPVYNVQITSTGKYIVFESGYTGTGYKSTFFYIIQVDPGYCKEIWKGAASLYNFSGTGPYRCMDGSIGLNALDESFFYTKIDRMYNEFESFNKHDSITSQTEMLYFGQLAAKKQAN